LNVEAALKGLGDKLAYIDCVSCRLVVLDERKWGGVRAVSDFDRFGFADLVQPAIGGRGVTGQDRRQKKQYQKAAVHEKSPIVRADLNGGLQGPASLTDQLLYNHISGAYFWAVGGVTGRNGLLNSAMAEVRRASLGLAV
jgi:hypothetical protein